MFRFRSRSRFRFRLKFRLRVRFGSCIGLVNFKVKLEVLLRFMYRSRPIFSF